MKLTNYPTIVERKIRIAVVGCGRISKNHFGSIEQHQQDLELVAVCDVDSATLKRHTDQYRVPGYTNLATMLQKEKLDMYLFDLIMAHNLNKRIKEV